MMTAEALSSTECEDRQVGPIEIAWDPCPSPRDRVFALCLCGGEAKGGARTTGLGILEEMKQKMPFPL